MTVASNLCSGRPEKQSRSSARSQGQAGSSFFQKLPASSYFLQGNFLKVRTGPGGPLLWRLVPGSTPAHPQH